jgi:hypothetical protein
MRARAMRIEAHLPEDLWPEACKTAPYLLNRTPTTKQLGWKTPLETLQQALGKPIQPPNIAHISGYLAVEPTHWTSISLAQGSLNREPSNIYRIWIPSKKKVIATRDVTFNESLFYNPNEPQLDSQLKEATPEILDTIEYRRVPQLLFRVVLRRVHPFDGDRDWQDREERTPKQEGILARWITDLQLP